jgi:hypothetical protein
MQGLRGPRPSGEKNAPRHSPRVRASRNIRRIRGERSFRAHGTAFATEHE